MGDAPVMKIKLTGGSLIVAGLLALARMSDGGSLEDCGGIPKIPVDTHDGSGKYEAESRAWDRKVERLIDCMGEREKAQLRRELRLLDQGKK